MRESASVNEVGKLQEMGPILGLYMSIHTCRNEGLGMGLGLGDGLLCKQEKLSSSPEPSWKAGHVGAGCNLRARRKGDSFAGQSRPCPLSSGRKLVGEQCLKNDTSG